MRPMIRSVVAVAILPSCHDPVPSPPEPGAELSGGSWDGVAEGPSFSVEPGDSDAAPDEDDEDDEDDDR